MKAECTWGDGPDVLVSLEGTVIVPYHEPKEKWDGKIVKEGPAKGKFAHGIITEGSFDLTADESLELAHELRIAAERAKELDTSVKNL